VSHHLYISPSTTKISKKTDIVAELSAARARVASDVTEYKFSRQELDRFKLVRGSEDELEERCKSGVLYWMRRDKRVQDNWAMLHGQKLAMAAEAPFAVVTALPEEQTERRHHFMIGGLKEVDEELRSLEVPFEVIPAKKGANPGKKVADLASDIGAGCVVTDFSPLREAVKELEVLKEELEAGIPVYLVDAHNIVPAWVASDKEEIGARTLRPKIHNVLDGFLKKFPPVVRSRHSWRKLKSKGVNWKEVEKSVKVDPSATALENITPGTRAGLERLAIFVSERLSKYDANRNNPNVDVLSGLSFWANFGQISMQRCIMYAKENGKGHAKAYVEEAVVRRELSDNFCLYNKNYDSLKGAKGWAQESLEKHASDKREHLYTQKELEEANTHDPLWNATQKQIYMEGKPHGYLRMYWAKKILEWTKSPKEALRIALYLNDHYCLDGCDPNGYVGVMWSVCGIHDQGWGERAVFGKIRCMMYSGCKRKFDVVAFERKYNKNSNNCVAKYFDKK